MKKGKIVAISISEKKGVKKKNVAQAIVKKNYGIVGDAHAGSQRQVSLLADESIEKIKAKGLGVAPGDFAENITTTGIVLSTLSIGTILSLGKSVVLEITQIGKVCHDRCYIYHSVGDCVMPKEGIFAKVVKGGTIKVCDEVSVN